MSRPAHRPKPKPELTLDEIRTLLATPPREPEWHERAEPVWGSAWAICRPHGAGLEVIDVTATLAEAHTIARRHPGAVAMFRSIRLIRITEDF